MKLFLLIAGTLTVLLGSGVVVSNSGFLSPTPAKSTVPDVAVAAPVQLSNKAVPATYGQSVAKLQTAELKVSGLYCVSCSFIVTRVLRGVPGVKEASVSGRTGVARVSFDPLQTNPEQLVAATTKHGFASRIIR